MVPPEAHDRITQLLTSVAAEEDAVILYAVESGSRAWGFASTDSDFDVRFIYIRRPEWYLSIDLESRRDVIERPCTPEMDLSGWDIRKALRLYLKSNPPLLEWLDSPFVYLDRHGFAERLRRLLPEFHSPAAVMRHYLHMARGNFREYLQRETVWLKKYFYVLRPLLACRWIEQGRGPVPMRFARLLATIEGQTQLITDVESLLERKMAGDELAEGPRIPAIHDFATAELERIESLEIEATRRAGSVETLNQLFREMLAVSWPST